MRRSVASLAPPERGLVAGLVDGDTSQLPAQTADDFRAAGLTHLVAVSGSNVAFVLAAVLVGARWVGLRGYAVPVAGAIGLCAFTVLARPEPSVVRAALMGLLVLASSQRGARGRTGPATLCAAVVVLLAVDPFLARSAGFALSVLATAGLLVLAPGWRDAAGAALAGDRSRTLSRPRSPRRWRRCPSSSSSRRTSACCRCPPTWSPSRRSRPRPCWGHWSRWSASSCPRPAVRWPISLRSPPGGS